MSKTLKIEAKLWLPRIQEPAICTAIFKRMLQNATWSTLARAKQVCKDWEACIQENFTQLAALPKVLSRQNLYINPITKFWLTIVGDQRGYCTFKTAKTVKEIQKAITELQKLAPKVQRVLENLKYSESDIFLDAMEKFPGTAAYAPLSSEGDQNLSTLEERRVLYLEINDVVKYSNVIAHNFNIQMLLSVTLPSITYIVSSLVTYALSSSGTFIIKQLVMKSLGLLLAVPLTMFIIFEILPNRIANMFLGDRSLIFIQSLFIFIAAMLGSKSIQ